MFDFLKAFIVILPKCKKYTNINNEDNRYNKQSVTGKVLFWICPLPQKLCPKYINANFK